MRKGRKLLARAFGLANRTRSASCVDATAVDAPPRGTGSAARDGGGGMPRDILEVCVILPPGEQDNLLITVSAGKQCGSCGCCCHLFSAFLFSCKRCRPTCSTAQKNL